MDLTDNIVAYWNLNDDGSGGVSLVDSTGNGYTLTNTDVALGTGIIAGDGTFNGTSSVLENGSLSVGSGDFSFSVWINPSSTATSAILNQGNEDDDISYALGYSNEQVFFYGARALQISFLGSTPTNTWSNVCLTNLSGSLSLYVNGSLVGTGSLSADFSGTPFKIGLGYGGIAYFEGGIDEIGVWSRALTLQEVSDLYNNGLGNTYPFAQTPTANLYYNNAENDGDWGNLLNWWQDSSFTNQATALPTATNPVNLYNEVTQNTEGANQCFCSSANFWSANFGAGLTLQASGVVNMQGTSIMAGATTDGVSMHDSSQLTATSVVDGNVTMRDGSRAFGSILGNATIYYDGGNGQYPIGGTVAGSVTYLGWPAKSPQWFNDQASGGGNNGDFSDLDNWWSDDTYTTRPLNTTGTQELPDASTDVFIAPNTGITANTGTANPTINSVTANNSNIQNISLTATNGFLFSGNDGAQNATLYGSVTFQDTAYNDHSVIQGTVTYKSAASLQNSWNQNSLGNLNSGASVGSTGFVVNISGGGGASLGNNWISRLLHLPWFINV